MKSRILLATSLIVLSVIESSFGAESPNDKDSEIKAVPTRLETVAYYWEAQRVSVTFLKRAEESRWIMSIRDSTGTIEKALISEGVIWELNESRCSLAESLSLVKRSLADFRTLKPDAKIESVVLEMQVIKEFWGEILPRLRTVLAALNGSKQATRLDTPDEVNSAMRQIVASSPTVKEIGNCLLTNGVTVKSPSQCNEIIFKDSLAGKPWREIATIPGVGVLFPGAIEFIVAH